MKKVLCKGYVRPYNASAPWVLALIFLGCGTVLYFYMLHEVPELYPTALWALMAWSALCCMGVLIMLTFDKTEAQYCITSDAVYSRNLLKKNCVLEDAQVRQIELTLSIGDVHRYNLHATSPHLICSDGLYKHDSHISLSYHRKHQVAVKITRKNFPAVQAYLARMGIALSASNYDTLVQLLGYEHEIYRQENGAWKRHY